MVRRKAWTQRHKAVPSQKHPKGTRHKGHISHKILTTNTVGTSRFYELCEDSIARLLQGAALAKETVL